MYEFFEGRIASQSPTRLVLDVEGVGYDLAVPLGARFGPHGPPGERASAGPPEKVRVWAHLVVRDDAHLLFGFADSGTRDLFRMLLKVRGVGPTMALGLLSGLSPDDLLQALEDGDAKRFTIVKGVGRKTADQIVLDLRDKTGEIAALLGRAAGAPGAPLPQTAELALDERQRDAVFALLSIGYGEKDARRAVERAAGKSPEADLETLIRSAIQS